MPTVTLADRALIAVVGEDAGDFLQSIITTNVSGIQPGEIWPGALLTPQGKIFFEFLIARIDGGFQLETAAAQTDALVRRLTLYKLRAKVTITRVDSGSIQISWDGERPAESLLDIRFARAGISLFRKPAAAGSAGDDSAYRSLRIANGITGGAEDGSTGDYFPHDLLMDRNGGLDFKKGCYVGQEVVSRMQHRSTARRRPMIVIAGEPIADGVALLAGEREIGTVLASSGSLALAIARIDKAGAALASGEALTLGGKPVTVALPDWSGLEFPATEDETAP